MANKKLLISNVFLLVLVAALVIFPLFYNSNADFGGADGKAGELIEKINPYYQPWFSSVWEPPSGEIENLLFVLQGALGAGVIGYFLGYIKGKQKEERE